MLSIYVLPTEEGKPPRAILSEIGAESLGDTIEGALVIWSHDMGVWTLAGIPLPAELGDVITAHAKSLGVEW